MITSRTNALIKEIQKLHETRYRAQTGFFTVEGDKFIRDISARGISAVNLISSDPQDEFRYLNDGFVHVSADIAQYLSEVKSPQGLIAVYKIPVFDEEQLYNCKKILLLDNIQNPDNVGALIRSASCAGFDAAVLFGSCADAYGGKSVRSSAGCIADYILRRVDISALRALRKAGFDVVGSSLQAKGEARRKNGKFILCVGNEGNGMSDEVIAECDLLVKLPMKGRCESLNAACAGTLLMYITGGLI